MIWGGGTSSGGGRLGILKVLSSQSPPPVRMLKVWFSHGIGGPLPTSQKAFKFAPKRLFDVPRFSESQIEFFSLVSPRFVAFSTFRDFQKAVLQFRRVSEISKSQTAFFRLVSPRFVTKTASSISAENRSISLQSSFFDPERKTAACSRLKIAQFRPKAVSLIVEKKQLHVRG